MSESQYILPPPIVAMMTQAIMVSGSILIRRCGGQIDIADLKRELEPPAWLREYATKCAPCVAQTFEAGAKEVLDRALEDLLSGLEGEGYIVRVGPKIIVTQKGNAEKGRIHVK